MVDATTPVGAPATSPAAFRKMEMDLLQKAGTRGVVVLMQTDSINQVESVDGRYGSWQGGLQRNLDLSFPVDSIGAILDAQPVPVVPGFPAKDANGNPMYTFRALSFESHMSRYTWDVANVYKMAPTGTVGSATNIYGRGLQATYQFGSADGSRTRELTHISTAMECYVATQKIGDRYTVKVDGVQIADVTATAAGIKWRKHEKIGMPVGAHTMVITFLSGTCIFDAIDTHLGSERKGVRVVNAGRSGVSLNQYAATGPASNPAQPWADLHPLLADDGVSGVDIGIMSLATNNQGDSETAFQGFLDDYAARFLAVNKRAVLHFMFPAQPNSLNAATSDDWQSKHRAARRVASKYERVSVDSLWDGDTPGRIPRLANENGTIKGLHPETKVLLGDTLKYGYAKTSAAIIDQSIFTGTTPTPPVGGTGDTAGPSVTVITGDNLTVNVDGSFTFAATITDASAMGVVAVRSVAGDLLGTMKKTTGDRYELTSTWAQLRQFLDASTTVIRWFLVALDAEGNSTTSSARNLTVPVSTTAPVPPVISNVVATGFNVAGSAITISADVTHASGIELVPVNIENVYKLNLTRPTSGNRWTGTFDRTEFQAGDDYAIGARSYAGTAVFTGRTTYTLAGGVDTTAPTGNMTKPVTNTVLPDTLKLEAYAVDPDSGVAKVEFYVEDKFLIAGAYTSAGLFSADISKDEILAQSPDGRRLRARMEDKAGNVSYTSWVTFTIPGTSTSIYVTPKTSRPDWHVLFEAAMAKRSNRPVRVAMLGDSITEGYGADDIYKTWPSLLQVELEKEYATTGVTAGSYTVSGSKVTTVARGSFQYISAMYAFNSPTPATQTLARVGAAADSSQWGLGRKATTQGLDTERSWTGRATSVDFIVYNNRTTNAYSIYRDDVLIKKVTTATIGRSVIRATGGSLTADSTYKIVFDNNTLPYFEGIAIYRNTENRGIQVWESAKSNTEVAQFIYSDTYNSTAQAQWIKDLVALLPDVINVAWITNDNSSFKRTPEQYKTSMRILFTTILEEGRKIDPNWNPLFSIVSPQERKEVTLKTMPEGWEAYVVVQHELANEFGNMFVESMSSPGLDGLPHIAKQGNESSKMSSDGIHPSSYGYVDYATTTVDAWKGVFSTGKPSTGTPPVDNTPDPGTKPPVTTLNFSHVGDSLAEEYTVNNTKLKNAYSGSTFVSQAKGGWLSAEAAAYQGGVPAQITVTNKILPATGTTPVTLDVNLLAMPGTTDKTWSATGTYLNTPVKLTTTRTNGVYSFVMERTTTGTAVSATTAAPFYTGEEHRNRLMLLQFARNDFHISTPAQVVERVRAMFAWNNRPADDHLLFEIPAKNDELPGTAYRIKLDAMNAALKAAFPKNWVESAKYLRSEAILTKAGLTATATDKQNIIDGITPESFRSDSMHYNALAYGQISDLVVSTLTAKGFTPVNAPAPDPTPTPTVDTTPPAITILGPAAGTVSGTVPFRARITDAGGVAFVAIYSGPGTLVGRAQLIAGETDVYGLDKDYADLQGLSGFRFVAKDVAGNSITSSTRAMTVAALPVADDSSPIISNIVPGAGSELLGPIPFKATVTINEPNTITDVVLYYKQELLGRMTRIEGTDNYSLILNSGDLPRDMDRYTVTARASNGKTAATELFVTVKVPTDTTGPVIVVTSPSAGQVLKGTVPFRATVSDPQSVVTRVWVTTGDTILLEAAELGGGVWGGDIAVEDLPATLVTLNFRARNANGLGTMSNPVPVLMEEFSSDYFAGIDKDTYLPPAKTVFALRRALLGEQSQAEDVVKLVNIGDSLAWNWGVNGNSDAIIAALGQGRYINTGVSGQKMDQIAARQGGVPAKAVFPGNKIQKSGTVTLTSLTPNMFAFNGPAGSVSQDVSVSGVRGVMTATKDAGGSYTFKFTRKDAGAEVGLVQPIEVLTGFEHRNSIMVLGLGRNDNISNAASPSTLIEPADVVAYVQSMLDWNQRDKNEHLVRTIPMKFSETQDSVANQRLKAINFALHEAFPQNIFDDAAFLRSELTMNQAGLVVTDQDRTDIAAGLTPTQFRLPSDTLHYNKKAYNMINVLLLRELKARGIGVNWTEPDY
jgi:lysophospholipase L1-like esterase